MKFFYIYKSLAHPEHNGYVTPFTLNERLLHVKEANRTLGSKIGWICDSMDNGLKHALGNAPNSEFVIGPDLKVLVKRQWSDPTALRKDLEKLIGKVDKPTQVADLNLPRRDPPKVAASGVVKRPQLPGGLQAVKIEPVLKEGGQPFYSKLRAEADSGLLRNGKGKLYLGFHLDPIYKVHWNNLTKPIKVVIESPQGTTISQTTLEGPKVKVESDIDPREFLVDVTAGDTKRPIKLTVSYFACNDEAGWCKAIKQEYVVHLQADRDGGNARRGGRGGPRRPGGIAGGGPGGNRTQGRIVSVDVKAGTVTLMTRDRKQSTYKIDASARLGRDRQRAELTDFKPDDMVMLQIEKSKDGSSVIRGMMARSTGGPGPRRRMPE